MDKRDVIDGVRAAADMDHPWIPGGQADLIRAAADLLEKQEEEVDTYRNLMLITVWLLMIAIIGIVAAMSR